MIYDGEDLGELNENMQMMAGLIERRNVTPASVADWLADNHDELVDVQELTGKSLVLTFVAVMPDVGNGPRLYSIEAGWQ